MFPLLLLREISLLTLYSYGQTALHIACGRNHLDVVMLLLAASCNINAVDQYDPSTSSLPFTFSIYLYEDEEVKVIVIVIDIII